MATKVPTVTKDPMAKKVPMPTKVPMAKKIPIATKCTNRTKFKPCGGLVFSHSRPEQFVK